MALDVQVSSRLVSVLMTQVGIYGLPGPARVKRLKDVATAEDLVNRKFHRPRANELWVTDIIEHPTRHCVPGDCRPRSAHRVDSTRSGIRPGPTTGRPTLGVFVHAVLIAHRVRTDHLSVSSSTT